jgi:hypothetical protein
MEARSGHAAAKKWSPSPGASRVVQQIHAMLHPRNIVLVGATDKPGNYAERIWTNLIKYGFEGGLNLMLDAGNRIASIDVNPFLVNARTGVAVDGLIVLNNAAAKNAGDH